MGFDDIEEAEAFWPPLTIVRQNLGDVGRIRVQTLVAMIEGSEAPETRGTVATESIERRSTAPPL